ncbi:MAG: signal recognition particle-docking protein FtsY [Chloroflexi bacterium]|nr:MAG: signal recognition particle-docking protein FtsY [Chloroflexota bacterium]
MFGWFGRKKEENKEKLDQGLTKTRDSVFGRIKTLLGPSDVTPDFYDELETLLLQADLGVATTEPLVESLKKLNLKRTDEVRSALKQRLVGILTPTLKRNGNEQRLLTVWLFVGVNGSGKTTSIAKIAHMLKAQGKRVVLAAGDTFRAAAIDQLQVWGQRVGVDVVAQRPGSDPGAVVFDSIVYSFSHHADVLLIDTAGRLTTKFNLMQELKKLYSICAKQVHQAPHETFLVLDATTGQNAISQAKNFTEAAKITGIILTKLDGTAKGGVAFAIAKELGIPIRFVTTGEKLDDIAEFDPKDFVEGLFE